MGTDQPFQREDENCEGEDLKCALALGVPAVVVLLVTLSIYLICRYVEVCSVQLHDLVVKPPLMLN